MKTNYHQLMLSQLANVHKSTDTLLLHCCCAPCLTHSLCVMMQYFDNITVYYSNDNITDSAEWSRRYEEVVRLIELVNSRQYVTVPNTPIQLIAKPLDSAGFVSLAEGYEQDAEGQHRCKLCYTMRLADSYHYAHTNGYTYYTTTLSISPYKNEQWLNEIGQSNSGNSTVFLHSDFKKQNGYQHSIALSNQYNIYRQHYCGCDFSKNI